MLTFTSAMTGVSQYALIGRKATVNAVLATAAAIAAALQSSNEPISPKEARKAVYDFLMEQGADKSTAALYRDAGALVYRAVAAKAPTTLQLIVDSSEIGAAVAGLTVAISKLSPGASASRASLEDWAKGVLGIKKAEKAEKTFAERVEALAWDPLESTCRHASLSIL